MTTPTGTIQRGYSSPIFGEAALKELGLSKPDNFMGAFMSSHDLDIYANQSPIMQLLYKGSFGSGKAYTAPLTSTEYVSKFMTVPTKLDSVLADPKNYAGSSSVSLGMETPVEVMFTGKGSFRFRKDHNIITWSKTAVKYIRAVVMEVIEAGTDSYTVKLMCEKATRNSYIPPDVLKPGTIWEEAGRSVSRERHDAGTARFRNYQERRGNLAYFRDDFPFGDAAVNSPTLPVKFPVFKDPKNPGNMSFEEKLFTLAEVQMMFDHVQGIETELLHGESNFDLTTGTYLRRDPLTGEVIPKADGIYAQCPIKGTYGKYAGVSRQLESVVSGIRRRANQQLAGPKTILGITGPGGAWAIREDLNDRVRSLGMYASVGDKFLQNLSEVQRSATPTINMGINSSSGLIFGNVIDAFMTSSKDIIVFIEDPLLERAAGAESRGIHPESQMPIAGHDFLFIDLSEYPNEQGTMVPNMQLLHMQGIQMLQTFVAGSAMNLPSSWSLPGQLRSTSKAESLMTLFSSAAINIANTQLCGRVMCEI